ncbi:uncharacterized protein BDZ99DRAFT_106339 [Mytilinidion resinicola]|uniref:Uncharacterized protein n=1 Tax=Mytilinidion resinicola TaxID=574789 RepID=A0A6A6YAA9_9PEZI|nr:uncharacterized protein BDZ99DRAFT_106339 [Mytilinidion resinicola]KAF2805498.1 hypothetical protein BDZ99DRAFT_106339 [Mytilinidion resinicola]
MCSTPTSTLLPFFKCRLNLFSTLNTRDLHSIPFPPAVQIAQLPLGILKAKSDGESAQCLCIQPMRYGNIRSSPRVFALGGKRSGFAFPAAGDVKMPKLLGRLGSERPSFGKRGRSWVLLASSARHRQCLDKSLCIFAVFSMSYQAISISLQAISLGRYTNWILFH